MLTQYANKLVEIQERLNKQRQGIDFEETFSRQ